MGSFDSYKILAASPVKTGNPASLSFSIKVADIIGDNNQGMYPSFGTAGPEDTSHNGELELYREALEGSGTAIVKITQDSIEISGAQRLGISGVGENAVYTTEEWLELIREDYRERYRNALSKALSINTKFEFDYPIIVNGRTIWVLAEGRVSEDGIIGTMKNVIHYASRFEKIEISSNTDGLTGLLNRKGFHQKLEGLIATGRSSDKENFSILYIDLDGFKEVNDKFGHKYGNDLLRQIAHNISQAVRSGDIVARWGGDEFAIALPRTFEIVGVEGIARKIKHALDKEYTLEGTNGSQTFHFKGGSIGIALFKRGVDTIETIESKADAAMYKAKKGGTGIGFFDDELEKEMVRNRSIIDFLRTFLTRGIGEDTPLSLVYQPIYSGASIISFEALLRFQTPDGEEISPDILIPLAEKSGLIIPLGKAMIRAVAVHLKKWQEAGKRDIPSISINISALQLNTELYYDLGTIIHETGVNPKLLDLEITESLAIENKVHVLDLLKRIKSLGVNISIDDFGTRHSDMNLFNLFAEIPIDTLKIDKDFIRDLLTDPKKKEFYRIFLLCGNLFDIKIVVEGVENKKQLRVLKGIGFTYFQGYLLGKPEGIAGTEKLLARKNILEKIYSLITRTT